MTGPGAIHSDDHVPFAGTLMAYSRTVRAGDFVYTSGHTAVDAEGRVGAGDIRAQTLLVFEKLATTLASAGCTLADVIKVTVYLADGRDFFPMNAAFAEIFPRARPARTTVVAQPVLPTRIEIDAVAYRPA
jgi:enamine deaminase RidA (YjgF/YER057c/UK114 family)